MYFKVFLLALFISLTVVISRRLRTFQCYKSWVEDAYYRAGLISIFIVAVLGVRIQNYLLDHIPRKEQSTALVIVRQSSSDSSSTNFIFVRGTVGSVAEYRVMVRDDDGIARVRSLYQLDGRPEVRIVGDPDLRDQGELLIHCTTVDLTSWQANWLLHVPAPACIDTISLPAESM